MDINIDDTPAGDLPDHNYVRLIMGMIEAGVLPPGGVHETEVYHDPGCAIFKGGLCRCNVNIKYNGNLYEEAQNTN